MVFVDRFVQFLCRSVYWFTCNREKQAHPNMDIIMKNGSNSVIMYVLDDVRAQMPISEPA